MPTPPFYSRSPQYLYGPGCFCIPQNAGSNAADTTGITLHCTVILRTCRNRCAWMMRTCYGVSCAEHAAAGAERGGACSSLELSLRFSATTKIAGRAPCGPYIWEEMRAVTEWEYRKIDLNQQRPRSDELEMLNAAGADGWELVAITSNNIGVFEAPDRRACSCAIRVQQRRYAIRQRWVYQWHR